MALGFPPVKPNQRCFGGISRIAAWGWRVAYEGHTFCGGRALYILPSLFVSHAATRQGQGGFSLPWAGAVVNPRGAAVPCVRGSS